MTCADCRSKGHKGIYALFWEVTYMHKDICRCEIYSSLRRALEGLHAFPFLRQSLHDASGHLVAYTNDGKVVMCHA